MTYPFPVGKLRADPLNDAIAFSRPLFARKSVDETVNNSATLQNDDDLFVAVEANATYRFECAITHNSGTTPDFKAGWTFPTGLTMIYTRLGVGLAGGGNVHVLFPSIQTTAILDDGFAADRPTLMWGLVFVASTAGTLRLQWAQNTANASNTIVRAGSYLMLQRVP